MTLFQRNRAQARAPATPEKRDASYSLAELFVALTALAALGAIVGNSTVRIEDISAEQLVPLVVFAALTGGLIGGSIAIAWRMSVQATLLAIFVGILFGGLGANAVAVQVSWPHLVAGGSAVVLAALIMRVLSNRAAG